MPKPIGGGVLTVRLRRLATALGSDQVVELSVAYATGKRCELIRREIERVAGWVLESRTATIGPE